MAARGGCCDRRQEGHLRDAARRTRLRLGDRVGRVDESVEPPPSRPQAPALLVPRRSRTCGSLASPPSTAPLRCAFLSAVASRTRSYAMARARSRHGDVTRRLGAVARPRVLASDDAEHRGPAFQSASRTGPGAGAGSGCGTGVGGDGSGPGSGGNVGSGGVGGNVGSGGVGGEGGSGGVGPPSPPLPPRDGHKTRAPPAVAAGGSAHRAR